MDKIWLKSYPPNVPAEINPDQERAILQYLVGVSAAARDTSTAPAAGGSPGAH